MHNIQCSCLLNAYTMLVCVVFLLVVYVYTAHWMFEGGGVGSLVHGAVLQGRRYEASLSVWADGLRLSLDDPYSDSCTLKIRRGKWIERGRIIETVSHYE